MFLIGGCVWEFWQVFDTILQYCVAAQVTPTTINLKQTVEAMRHGETLVLGAGIYHGCGISVSSVNIVIKGAGRGRTEINCDGAGRFMTVTGGEGLTLEGLTVSNGTSSTEHGACLHVTGASLSLKNVELAHCQSGRWGGGIYASVR